jgi:hypothetical protein
MTEEASRAEGVEAGRRWASEDAELADLEWLERQASRDDNAGAEEWDWPSIFDWEAVIGAGWEDASKDPSFVRGFAAGALAAWNEMKDRT